jgi:hypothetical protein
MQPVKLILTYDPLPAQREEYIRFIMSEFVPGLERLGLKMSESWHTAYGSYPLRLTCFVASDYPTLNQVLGSDDFRSLEFSLQAYVDNYNRRIVPLKSRFQF